MPGHTHVLHVDVLGADLRGSIVARVAGPDDLVLGGLLHRRVSAERHVERFVADQLAVGDGATRARHNTLLNSETLGRRIQLRGCELEQRDTRFGGRRADLRSTAIDRRAGIRPALVGRDVGIEPHRLDLAHVQIEFLGRNLQQRRRRALPQFGETDIYGGGVVGVDREPGVHLLRIGWTGLRPSLLSY